MPDDEPDAGKERATDAVEDFRRLVEDADVVDVGRDTEYVPDSPDLRQTHPNADDDRTCPHCGFDHDDLAPHGDGEAEPHRPPKYVEGHYKPHFGDPDADFVLMRTTLFPLGTDDALYWALTDSDGDTAGVIRRLDGTPIYEGADMVAGHAYDGDVQIRDHFADRIDDDHVPPLPEQ